MNEVVKYHNDMNLVNFSQLTANEYNIFFAICQQMRDKSLSLIELNFEKIRELINYEHRGHERLIKDIESSYSKLLSQTIRIVTKKTISRFVLFTEFEINIENQTVILQTNKKFEYILNSITSNFTRFELEEFVSLKKANSKTVYKLLKQFRSTGFCLINYSEFLEMLGIEKWKSTDVTKELNRIIKDLTPLFENLKLNKIKKGNKQTGKIERLEFSFDIKKENSKASSDFLASERVFINYMRKNFVNQDIVSAPNKETGKTMLLSVSESGKLYDKYSFEPFDSKRSKAGWKLLYEFALTGHLACLKSHMVLENKVKSEKSTTAKKREINLNETFKRV